MSPPLNAKQAFIFMLIVSTLTAFSDRASADDPVVPPDAKVEKLAGGFKFTEGPAESPDGRIYFSDIPNERVHIYDPKTKQLKVHRENSGRANGLMFDQKGGLLACEGGNRRLTRQNGEAVKVLADRYQGKRLNSPNDLALDSRGGIYFTDPRYGNRDDMEMQVEGVYYLPPSGGLVRVIDDLQRPNGLTLSLDKKTLYVADNAAKTILSYHVNDNGTLRGKSLFAKLVESVRGGCDGLTLN